MSDIAIGVEGVGKMYKIGKKKSGDFRESFSHFWNKFKPSSITNHQSPTTNHSEFWALKDISFEVKQGEAVGIIGRNGAGKSTLLKILSRITRPTTGRFEINGRVSSLLEVGTGFHPELTGRENIYLNGTILGMRRAEIKAKFDEIVAFSGVEEFIDTPVKHYSSGMKVRLAFSVAAHLEPEILIIDEVLAVGDAEFQKKCLGKMEDVTSQGRTVLFVSHNMGAIQKLCRQGLLIHNGHLIEGNTIIKCVNEYLNNESKIHIKKQISFSEIDIISFNLFDINGNKRSQFSNSEEIVFQMNVFVKAKIKNYKFGIDIEDSLGTKLISTYHNDIETKHGIILEIGDQIISTRIPKYLFNEGQYFISILCGIHQEKWIFQMERALKFKIDFSIINRSFSANYRNSLLAPMLEWTISKNE